MTEFDFQILSPDRVIYCGKAVSIVAPGEEGYFGVMARHAAMLAALTAGEVRVTEASGRQSLFAVTGGVLEVSRDDVALLADAAERASEIDVQRAEAARQRAAERLERKSRDTDSNRAQAALLRALTRLRVAARGQERR